MEILVSKFPITEKSVNESDHTKTHACKETARKTGRHIYTHVTNMHRNE